MADLSMKQKKFVAAYLANGQNATNAAISAGYSENGASVQASRLLANAKISALIANKTEKMLIRLDYSVERTLNEVARLAFFDPRKFFESDGSLKRIHELDDDHAAAIAGMEVTELFEGTGDEKHAYGLLKKIKLVDKGSALDKLMRYHALYKDKLDLNININLAERLANARKRLPGGDE